MLRSIQILLFCVLLNQGVLCQDTIRIVDGNVDYFEFVNEQYILKDTAEAAHYMIYSRYIESILVREFDVVDHKLNGKDIAYNFPYDFAYSITHWKNGLMDGLFTLYRGDTIPDLEIEMEKGWPHGQFSKYEISGDTLLRVLHGYFTNGIMDSIWTQYLSEGGYRPYKYIQTYTFKDGEIYLLSWKAIYGAYTLVNGDGFISTTYSDTSFYKLGKIFKWVINSRDAHNPQKLSEVTEIIGEGIINKKVFNAQFKGGIPNPVFESNYLIDGYCIDTTIEVLEVNSIHYLKLQKNYQLIPHGKFIGYKDKVYPIYSYNNLMEQLPIYNSIKYNPYFENYNYYDDFKVSDQYEYRYGILIGTATMSNKNNKVQINVTEKTEVRTNLFGNPIEEPGIYFETAGKTYFLHTSGNQKKISLSNKASDSLDIKVRFDHTGTIFADSYNCPEVVIGRYNIPDNYIAFYYSPEIFKIKSWNYHKYKPVKLANEGIILKRFNNFYPFYIQNNN